MSAFLLRSIEPCACGCGAQPNRQYNRHVRFCHGHNRGHVSSRPEGAVWSGNRMMLFQPTHPRANVRGYVYRATVTAERVLGRFLREGEEVHHVNRIPSDDRHQNLVIMHMSAHHRMHALQNRLGHRR